MNKKEITIFGDLNDLLKRGDEKDIKKLYDALSEK